ncbi:glycosyltransferase family 4 protein [Priestia aryabhattai]|uniref:glycosyltransferase family 4 protein n=1 Tax=Priestia aryabhattai TaxID=412384 RepID=UPI003D2BF3AF
MKKLLYVRNGPYVVNPSLYNLQEIGFCKALASKGISADIIYYAPENKNEIIYKDDNAVIRILWRKGYKFFRTGLYPSLLKKSFVNEYDMIITTEYSQIMSLLWTYFKPKVVLYNGPYYNLFKIPFCEKVYDTLFVKAINKRVDKTFTKSTKAQAYLEKKGFCNVSTLGVGLNNEIFEAESETVPPHIQKIINHIKDTKNILYVGSLDERKNFSFLIRVFKLVLKREKNIKLIVVGKGKKGYVNKCLSAVGDDIAKNIIIYDKVENRYLKEIYINSNAFVLPSKKEIFGMVLLEAMYFGVPAITSDNGGSSTLIENADNGFIIKEFDEVLWSETILNVIENKQLSQMISNNAELTIKNNFTWNSIVDKFLSEISNIER